MPTTITLKNIPDDVYQRLKASAEINRRSLNSEAIVRLEEVLLPQRTGQAQRLSRIVELRASLGGVAVNERTLGALKRQGRA
ncbi:MAG: Arc family DNA-binding protein [Betaproteobacteria bacterium]|nr:MAG: Arc family DNA-binding protein [Betaproteobacteria bacterium]